MTNHHFHEALARQRAEEIRLHPRTPRPRRDSSEPRRELYSSFAPVVSVVAGFLGLLAIAAPSL